MVATRARRASGEGTPKQTATKRVAARSKSPAPRKPAARARGDHGCCLWLPARGDAVASRGRVSRLRVGGVMRDARVGAVL